MNALIEDIIAHAKRVHGWSQGTLALYANLTPEGLSRAKGNSCRLDTVERLAKAAGMRIIVIPDDTYVADVLSGKLLGDF